jgi:hypothetical protein
MTYLAQPDARICASIRARLSAAATQRMTPAEG